MRACLTGGHNQCDILPNEALAGPVKVRHRRLGAVETYSLQIGAHHRGGGQRHVCLARAVAVNDLQVERQIAQADEELAVVIVLLVQGE